MKPSYRIHSHRSAGNLHISLFGEFNGMCAWALFKTIRLEHAGACRVFVNTAGLGRVTPEGTALFLSHMMRRPMPPDWLYFKGETGFRIAPDGSRVLICKKDKRCRRSPEERRLTSTGTVQIQSRPPHTTIRSRRNP